MPPSAVCPGGHHAMNRERFRRQMGKTPLVKESAPRCANIAHVMRFKTAQGSPVSWRRLCEGRFVRRARHHRDGRTRGPHTATASTPTRCRCRRARASGRARPWRRAPCRLPISLPCSRPPRPPVARRRSRTHRTGFARGRHDVDPATWRPTRTASAKAPRSGGAGVRDGPAPGSKGRGSAATPGSFAPASG